MSLSSISELPGLRTLEQQQASSSRGSGDELGQEDFLTLMIAQLENQDPTKPVDNFEYLSQIAQFSQVRGIQELQSSFARFNEQFSTQMAVDAASMIGSEAILATDFLQLRSGEPARASIDVPAGVAGIEISVRDTAGNLVDRFNIGGVKAGIQVIEWDGKTQSGSHAAEGTYNLTAVVRGQAQQQEQLVPLYIHDRVDSVLFDRSGAGVRLGMSSGAEVGMADIVGFINS